MRISDEIQRIISNSKNRERTLTSTRFSQEKPPKSSGEKSPWVDHRRLNRLANMPISPYGSKNAKWRHSEQHRSQNAGGLMAAAEANAQTLHDSSCVQKKGAHCSQLTIFGLVSLILRTQVTVVN